MIVTIYEWTIEENSMEAEVQDFVFRDKIDQFSSEQIAAIGKDYRLVLRKEICHTDAGRLHPLHRMQTYYAGTRIGADGVLTLPEMFDEGTEVPKQFHAELAKARIAPEK